MTYEDLIFGEGSMDKRCMRLAWNEANTNVINAIAGIAFREVGNGNHETAKMLIELVRELHPVLAYKEAE